MSRFAMRLALTAVAVSCAVFGVQQQAQAAPDCVRKGTAAQKVVSEKNLAAVAHRMRAAGADESEVEEVFAEDWCLRRVSTPVEESSSTQMRALAEPGVGPSDVVWQTGIWEEGGNGDYYIIGMWEWQNHDYSSHVTYGCWNHSIGGLDAIGLRLTNGPYVFDGDASVVQFWGDPRLNGTASDYELQTISGASATSSATDHGITYQRQDNVRATYISDCASGWDFDMYAGEIIMKAKRVTNTCALAQVIPINIHTWNSTSVNTIGAGPSSFSIGWTNAGSAQNWEHHGEVGELCGSDSSGGGGGTGNPGNPGGGTTPPPPPPPDAPIDYDKDDYSDIALYRQDCSTGSTWSVRSSRTGTQLEAGTKYGGCNDIPASGDYDGDGHTDLALYRRDCGAGSTWWIRSSRTGTQLEAGTKYGGCTDIPAPGDYNGDKYDDIALYRQDCSTGSTWWVRSSKTGTQLRGGFKYGGCKDIPAPGDYNGDEYADLALYRRDCGVGSTWWIKSSRTGTQLHAGTRYGGCNDIPASSNPATTS